MTIDYSPGIGFLHQIEADLFAAGVRYEDIRLDETDAIITITGLLRRTRQRNKDAIKQLLTDRGWRVFNIPDTPGLFPRSALRVSSVATYGAYCTIAASSERERRPQTRVEPVTRDSVLDKLGDTPCEHVGDRGGGEVIIECADAEQAKGVLRTLKHDRGMWRVWDIAPISPYDPDYPDRPVSLSVCETNGAMSGLASGKRGGV